MDWWVVPRCRVSRRAALSGLLVAIVPGCLGDDDPEVVYDDEIERGEIGEIYELQLEAGMGVRVRIDHQTGNETDLEIHDPDDSIIYDTSTNSIVEHDFTAETAGIYAVNVRTEQDGSASVTVWVAVDPE